MRRRIGPWLLALAAAVLTVGSCGLPVRVGIEHARAGSPTPAASPAPPHAPPHAPPPGQPRIFVSQPGPNAPADMVRSVAPAPGPVVTAQAQTQPQPPPSPPMPRVVTLPPVPQPAGPQDVVGVRLESAGPARRQIVTFGQVFARGQVPRGSTVSAQAGGSALPTQLDIKTTHPDGSVRMGVVSIQTTAPADVMLRRVPAPPPGALVNLGELHGRYDARVRITVHGAGEPLRHDFDLAGLLEKALVTGQVSFWLHGPLVTEGRIEMPVTGSMRLIADIRAFADGPVLTDIQFNNDIAYPGEGGELLYDATIIANGKTVLHEQDIRHYRYQTWHREVWSGAAPSIHVVRDPRALARAGAIYNYDVAAGVDAGLLAGMTRQMNGPGFGILGNAGVTKYMPMTGGRADIGPTTQANTVWLMTQHPDAERYALAQADAAGSVPWHFHDRNARTYVSAIQHPKLWIDGRGGRWGTVGLPELPDDTRNGWSVDSAHQPDLSYVPYILTGSRYRYDQLEAQATFSILIISPDYRQGDKAMIVPHSGQVRGNAWTYRVIDHAAFIAPDSAPLRGYFQASIRNSIAFLRAEMPTRTIGEIFGTMIGDRRPAPDGTRTIAPWEQDFMATVLSLSAMRGVDGARETADWMANFVAGRFTSEAKGFRPNNGITFDMIVTTGTPPVPYLTWREIEAINIQRGLAKDGTEPVHTDRNIMRIARGTMAALVNATNRPEAVKAFEWTSTNLPGTTAAQFLVDPSWNIVPFSSNRP